MNWETLHREAMSPLRKQLPDQIQQVFHHPVQAALGQLSAGLAGNGEKADVDGVAAAQNGAGLGVIQDFEEVVLADQRAPGAVRLPQLFLHRTHGYGPVVYGAGRLAVPVPAAPPTA